MQCTPDGLFDSYFALPVLRVSLILSQRLSQFPGSAHAGVFFYEAMRLVVDPYSLVDEGKIRIVASQLADIVFRHPESFARSTDDGNQS